MVSPSIQSIHDWFWNVGGLRNNINHSLTVSAGVIKRLMFKKKSKLSALNSIMIGWATFTLKWL